METPTNIELLDHIAGRGDPKRREEIESALRQSPQLRKRFDELQSLWNLLGEADVDVPARDLWHRVATRLNRGQYRPAAATAWWARAAAAVLLAACIGHLAGRLTPRQAQPLPAVTEVDVAKELALDALASTPVARFAEGLETDPDEMR